MHNIKNRSSVIFPLFINKGVSNKIYFLNYWKMKNDLSNTDFQVTLRDYNGYTLNKIFKNIGDVATASVIDVEQEFNVYLNDKFKSGFKATLEIELFFENAPKFNFPALILNYSDTNNSSYVHSCLRSYNIGENPVQESIEKNQTGFNIYNQKDLKNYLVFVTGKQKKYNFKISIQSSNEIFSKEIIINNENPYKLIEINFDDTLSLFSNISDIYKVSIDHNISDIFSRFYVGNYRKNQIPTLTHTFFDEHKYSNDNKSLNGKNWDSAFSFPFFDPSEFNNILASFECNKLWEGLSRFEFLDSTGNPLFKEDITVNENFSLFKTSFLNINELFLKSNLLSDQVKTFKISFKGNIPTRNKYGLNYSYKSNMSGGSNVCFAPIVHNKSLIGKPFSTNWGPLGGSKNIVFYYNNTNINNKSNDKRNKVSINFINSNGVMMKKEYNLFPDQILELNVSKNKELASHFNKQVGWCFLKTDNNYSNSWYFQFGKDMIGGDHSF